MSDFIIYGYEENSSWMYNRGIELGRKDRISKAVDEAQYHKRYGRYYQTSVNYKGRMVVACRGDKTYKFFHNEVFDKINKAAGMLTSSIMNDYGKINGYYLYDSDGKVNIDIIEGSQRVTKYEDVLDMSFNWVQNYARELIIVLQQEMIKPIHSIYVNPSYSGDSLYITPSNVEVGSNDLKIDWF